MAKGAVAHMDVSQVGGQAVRDLDPAFITHFLDYLERERGNCARTRNIRLAAIHSFFTYAALQEPSAAAVRGAVAQDVWRHTFGFQ